MTTRRWLAQVATGVGRGRYAVGVDGCRDPVGIGLDGCVILGFLFQFRV